MVVRGQQVLALEEGVDPVTARQVDLPLDRGARRQLHPLAVLGAAVDVEPQVLGGRRPAGVAQDDPGVEAAAARLHGEAGDGPVRGPGAEALVVGAGGKQAALGVGQPAVGQEHEADRRARRLHALGQGEGGGEVGRAGRAPDAADGVVERVPVGAGRQDDPRLGVGHDHAGDAAARELTAQAAGLVLGRLQPVGLPVDRGHRAGRVDDEHRVQRQLGPGGAYRLGHRRGQEGHGQQLQSQQHAGPQLLPGRRHRDRAGHLPPQERRADLHRRPAGPQHVQRQHRDGQQRQPQPGRVGEPHRGPVVLAAVSRLLRG